MFDESDDDARPIPADDAAVEHDGTADDSGHDHDTASDDAGLAEALDEAGDVDAHESHGAESGPDGNDDDDLGDKPFTFADLGLRTELLDVLHDLGYEEPTPVQRETIPHVLEGRDLIGQAATGTGKTAAFALPTLHALDRGERGHRTPRVLVLVPTRELAMQVSEAMFKYGRLLGTKVVPVYGGQPIFRQLQALDRGADVVVGTPGRVVDHIGRASLPLDDIETVVLDEADEMLDMGFADDLESILESLPVERQTLLFSATMPPRIAGIAKRSLNDPVRVVVGGKDHSSGPTLITQRAYIVPRPHKAAALGRILDIEVPQAALVFCRTRTEVDMLTETMNGRGYRAEALHGGMDQAQRDRVMGRLRDGTAELLIATDVAARGLDVDTLTHVVNFDVPSAPESYVHRIGRVGRAGREGVAITLAEPRERRLLANIERATKQKIAMQQVPSVADLRAKQVELTVSAVRAAMSAEDLDRYVDVLDALIDDDSGELRDIALAAVKLVHEASGATTDEPDIPEFVDRSERSGRDRGDRRNRDDRGDGRNDRGGRQDRSNGPTAFVHVGAGRKSGVRPADLVGAIANESGLTGRDIGPIRITEHSSVVGVPVDRLDHVLDAMRDAIVRGKPVSVRKYDDQPHQGDRGGYRTPDDREGGGDRGGYRGNQNNQGGGGYRGNQSGDDRGGYRGTKGNPGGGGYRGKQNNQGGDDRGGYRGNQGNQSGGYRGDQGSGSGNWTPRRPR